MASVAMHVDTMYSWAAKKILYSIFIGIGWTDFILMIDQRQSSNSSE